ncbi:hypothetical protein [uncultured Devosia sp.]|uniref:hypothetical protein n=1 Tax=uncultured Devosia sp. TaxID=211434 RepID=UPI0026300332|nr:hypothetical protein [uncultured Devosia sp.]
MQNIIDRLKAAKDASRELDTEIFEAVTGNGVFDPANRKFWRPAGLSTREPLDFTRSLDDAVKLIPDGMFWLAGHGKTRPAEPLGGAQVFRPGDDLNPLGEGEGASVAIAICIAALDARQSLQPVT